MFLTLKNNKENLKPKHGLSVNWWAARPWTSMCLTVNNSGERTAISSASSCVWTCACVCLLCYVVLKCRHAKSDKTPVKCKQMWYYSGSAVTGILPALLQVETGGHRRYIQKHKQFVPLFCGFGISNCKLAHIYRVHRRSFDFTSEKRKPQAVKMACNSFNQQPPSGTKTHMNSISGWINIAGSNTFSRAMTWFQRMCADAHKTRGQSVLPADHSIFITLS